MRNINLSDIKKAIHEFLKIPEDKFEKPYLKEKILSGYCYKLSSNNNNATKARGIMINTGIGGVHLYIDACKKQGIPETLIEQSIEVFLNGSWHKLSTLNVQKDQKASSGSLAIDIRPDKPTYNKP